MRAIVFSGPSHSNANGLNVSEINTLSSFYAGFVTSYFDDDSIKNEQASMDTSLSHYKYMYMGYFSDTQGHLTPQ